MQNTQRTNDTTATTTREVLILVTGDHSNGALGVGSKVQSMSKSLHPLQFRSIVENDDDTMLHEHQFERQVFARQPEIKHCSAGAHHTLFISKDPCLLWACGSNSRQQLGLQPANTTSVRSSQQTDQDEVYTVFLSDVCRSETSVMNITCVSNLNVECCILLKVVCGKEVSFLLTSGMNWWGCGDNTRGTLSLPDKIRKVNSFVKLSHLKQFQIKDVFTSKFGHNTFYLSTDGKVYASGKNSYGSLGLGHSKSVFILEEITALQHEGISTVACGADFSLFLSNRGKLFGCGSTAKGKLGFISSVDLDTPVQIPFQHGNIVAVACGAEHTMVINESHELYGSGCNVRGQLGLCHMRAVAEFTKVVCSSPVQFVTCGSDFTIFQTADYAFWGVGNNTQGTLGLNHTVTWSRPSQIRSKIFTLWKQKGFDIQVECGAAHTVFYAQQSPHAQIANHFKHSLFVDSNTFSDVQLLHS